jgi:hypothetical protein
VGGTQIVTQVPGEGSAMVAVDDLASRTSGRAEGRRRGWRPILAGAALALSAIALLNVVGLVPMPGSALTPAGSSSDGSFSSGLLPAAGRSPGRPWVAVVSVHNFATGSISLTSASPIDLLPGTTVLAVTVDSRAGIACPMLSFDTDCVATAVVGGRVSDQTLVPGEDTFLMIVGSGPGSFSGFRDVRIGYREGPLQFTQLAQQGAWVCVGVPAETCPENPWPAH